MFKIGLPDVECRQRPIAYYSNVQLPIGTRPAASPSGPENLGLSGMRFSIILKLKQFTQ